MSESTDDAQRSTAEEVAPSAGDARPPSLSDADDVEVLAQAPEPPPPEARHDSVVPTSRKLAPPPKPKRDSSNPGSSPAPAELTSSSSSNAPSVSFQEATGSSREAALLAGESLRAIGDALAQEPGGFSKAEIGSVRPAVPRPRSQPSISINPPPRSPSEPAEARTSEARTSEPPRTRDKLPTVPDSPTSTLGPRSQKPASVSPQRIIAIGARADKPLAAPRPSPVQEPRLSPPPPPPLLLDLERALEGSPVSDHVVTAEPPPVVLSSVVTDVATIEVSAELPPHPLEVPAPPPELPPVPPLPEVAVPAVLQSLPVEVLAPVVAEAPAEEASFSVDVHVDEAPLDAPPDIPITTEFEEDTPTLPQALPHAFDAVLAAPPAGLTIPNEPTPAPPASAIAESSDEGAPDSGDRVQVEELSREDSPSVPPEEPASSPIAAAVPPPVPSTRVEAKPPPPPKRAPAPPAVEPAVEPAASEGEKRKSKQKRPWWEELFSEDFVRANWKVSDEQIKREVTFVEESLGVAPGGVVLDLGCGSGQHAVELASRGYGVVGYDLSLYQLALAADNAQERSQKLNFLQGDMREMAFEEMFDGIFCWNTSFGYFEEDKNFSVAERAFRALRPGGMLLVDVMNRDFVAAHTPSSVWFEGDSCVCMDDAVIDYFTSRLRVKRSVILDDGRTRECTYSVRLYSFHELGKLLHEVGFRVTEVSGHPATPGVFLGQASPRILMLAQRP